MKRTRDQRRHIALVKKTLNQAKRLRVPRSVTATSVIAQAGVPAANVHMTRGPVPNPQEVKQKDTAITSIPAGSMGTWTHIFTNVLAPIVPGTGNNQRIGSKIRVVGLAYRFQLLHQAPYVATAAQPSPEPYPFTVDFVWDLKPSGGVGAINQIYTGTASVNQPNVNYSDRFKFIKRIERPANQGNTHLSGVIKLNKEIRFAGGAGTNADLEDCNLLINLGQSTLNTTQLPNVMAGTVRILYVDA